MTHISHSYAFLARHRDTVFASKEQNSRSRRTLMAFFQCILKPIARRPEPLPRASRVSHCPQKPRCLFPKCFISWKPRVMVQSPMNSPWGKLPKLEGYSLHERRKILQITASSTGFRLQTHTSLDLLRASEGFHFSDNAPAEAQ